MNSTCIYITSRYIFSSPIRFPIISVIYKPFLKHNKKYKCVLINRFHMKTYTRNEILRSNFKEIELKYDFYNFRSGLKNSAFTYAAMLMRPEYRKDIDEKYK